MGEVSYEQMVSELERKWEARIDRMVERASVGRSGEYLLDDMRVEVEQWLLHHMDWDAVDACDISDIVLEAVDRWDSAR